MTTTKLHSTTKEGRDSTRSIITDLVICAYFAVFPLVVAIFLSAQVARAQILDRTTQPSQVTAMVH